jgi:hypothetical protein
MSKQTSHFFSRGDHRRTCALASFSHVLLGTLGQQSQKQSVDYTKTKKIENRKKEL